MTDAELLSLRDAARAFAEMCEQEHQSRDDDE